MSLESWKAEFYPVDASEAPADQATAHSLRIRRPRRKAAAWASGLRPATVTACARTTSATFTRSGSTVCAENLRLGSSSGPNTLEVMVAKVTVLKTDGTSQEYELPKPIRIERLQRLIGCDLFDSVNLRDGRVMLVDDTGLIDGKPLNKEATKLYASVWRPELRDQLAIAGDVVIVVDEDFA